ncbi:hypothetical protein CERSUDRAFT_94138 [Gelatoporia subvermispora B]|uniref:Uncharacterized protein n=1 Tax=Ceriporiopsis subvermispora (strain B) TaxID=914234 RepID=M2RJF9_CERS8|nr:hypothetical protein CERSUDRAFT_94138 [Gelatoporia subvermispora B]
MAPWGVSGTVSPTESAISSPIMSRTSSFMVYPVDFLQVKIPAGVFTPAEEPSRSVWTVR